MAKSIYKIIVELIKTKKYTIIIFKGSLNIKVR